MKKTTTKLIGNTGESKWYQYCYILVEKHRLIKEAASKNVLRLTSFFLRFMIQITIYIDICGLKTRVSIVKIVTESV